MKETELTVVGNVVNSPQRSRLASGASVTNFRLASTSRRFDRESQTWTDHRTLFLDVECWGELGGNVSHTLSKGDPVIVVGELYTHRWESEQGPRSRSQLRAEAVGPDLSRGVAEYRRTPRPAAPAGTVEEPPADPYAARSTDYAPEDYDGGPVALDDESADELGDGRPLVPSLT
ncbi:single-stranded DNA-binding protein [Modestobacter sp. SYSU DS0290]